jgi:phosphatidylserine/phosphatidylglycerophosphate/cardiolipin synthase-like enzyme
MKLNSKFAIFFIVTLLAISGCTKPVNLIGSVANRQVFDQDELDNKSTDQLIVIPEELDRPIIEAIKAAKHTIDLSNYHLSNRSVVSALIESANSGVQIRVILDNGVLAGSSTAQKIVNNLIQNNIQVKPSSKFFSITHQKSFVVDNKTVLISTINLVTTLATTRDFGLITHDKNVIQEVNAVFQADWENADTEGGVTPELIQEKLVWSPINSLPKLVTLISSAKVDIKVMVENLGSTEILKALIDQSKAGIAIKVLTPGCILGNSMRNRPFIKQLQDNKIENKVSRAAPDADHPYVHAKMILVDNETFFIGSENFSFNSLTKARELGIITSDIGNSKRISQVFDKDWGNSLAPEAVTAEDCEKASWKPKPPAAP